MKKIKLEREIEKTEKALESLKAKLKEVKDEYDFKLGDYVEMTLTTSDRVIVGKYRGFSFPASRNIMYPPIDDYSMIVGDVKYDRYMIKDIKKWQPKKGEMCIFWDDDFKDNSVIGVFGKKIKSQYYDTTTGWDNCIPFISEQQYKEHIGYEK